MKRILCLRIESQDLGRSRNRRRWCVREPQPIVPGMDCAKPTLHSGTPTYLQAVAARCKQFTPLVGIDPDVFPQSVLLDITNVVHLFGGEAALVQRILDELHAEGWQLRAAVAGTPGAAWALAAYGKEIART